MEQPSRERIIVLGELNGWGGWIDIKVKEYSKVVFLGNILSYDKNVCSVSEYYSNLTRLFALKRTYPDKVFLILGLDDLDYFTKAIADIKHGVPHENMKMKVFRQIREGQEGKMFDIAHQHLNWFITFGGILDDWFETNLPSFIRRGLGTTDMTFADILNTFWRGSLLKVVTEEGYNQFSRGLNWSPGPLWTTQDEVEAFPLQNACQAINGDIQQHGVSYVDRPESKAKIIACNALNYNVTLEKQRNNYLVLETK